MDIKEAVLNIMKSYKASYRQDEYFRAGLNETQVNEAIDLLIKEGLLKRNKRGAVSLVGGTGEAKAKRARASMNQFNR